MNLYEIEPWTNITESLFIPTVRGHEKDKKKLQRTIIIWVKKKINISDENL